MACFFRTSSIVPLAPAAGFGWAWNVRSSSTVRAVAPAAHPVGLGLWQGVALYLCAVLGAGVLALPGQAASLAGPASLLSWAFCAVLSVPLAFTFARLAALMPDAGGVAAYARKAFGSAAGGIAGWWYFIAGSVGQAVISLTAGSYLARSFGIPGAASPALAAGVLAAAFAVTVVGLRAGGVVQLILAAGVCAVLAVAVAAAVPGIAWSSFTPFAPHGIAGVGAAAVVLFYAFAGWEAVTHLSADFRTPRRDMPRATGLALGVVTVLYLCLAGAVVGTGSYGTTADDDVALARIVGDRLGLSPAIAIGVAAAVICVATASVFSSSVARLGFALARDGWAPAPMARLNGRGAPWVAALLVAAIGGAGLLASAAFGWGIGQLVVIPSTLVLVTYLLASAAAIRLLRGAWRILPVLSLAMISLVTPSAGRHLALPAAIAAVVTLASPLARRSGRGGSPRRMRRTDGGPG